MSLAERLSPDYEVEHRDRQSRIQKELGSLSSSYQHLSQRMSLDACTEEGFLSYVRSAVSPSSGLPIKSRARNTLLAAQRALNMVPFLGKYLVVQRPVSQLLEENLERVRDYGNTIGLYIGQLEQMSSSLSQGLERLNKRSVDLSEEAQRLNEQLASGKGLLAEVKAKYEQAEDKKSPEALKLLAEVDERRRAVTEASHTLRDRGLNLGRATNLAETDRVMMDAIDILYPEMSTLHKQVTDWVNESERTIKSQAHLTRATEIVTGTFKSSERLRRSYNEVFMHNADVVRTIAGGIGDIISRDLTDQSTLDYVRGELRTARERQLAFSSEGDSASDSRKALPNTIIDASPLE